MNVKSEGRLSFSRVARGAFYLYFSILVANVLGYVFWFIVSKLTSPDVVGLASTAVTVATIAYTFTMFGIPTGIQRFLGKAYAENDTDSLKTYFSIGLVILILASGIFACVIILLSGWLSSLTGLPSTLLIVAGLLTLTSSIYPLFYALFVSTLKTKLIVFVNLSASIGRLIVGILLVLIGLGALGIMLGYFTLSFIALVAYVILAFRFIGLPRLNFNFEYVSEVFKAGSVNWLPMVIQILGLQLGVLAVYGFQGAFHAGLYFIAYAVASVVLAIPMSFLGLMFPVLSGMEDGRKRASWRAIKLTLTIVVPVSVILAIYSKVFLGFIGSSYVDAWLILTILLVGIAPFAIIQGVRILAYAYGLYSLVLILGITVSLPRTLLYLILTPLFGGVGAAEAFLIGTITGLISVIFISRRIGLTLDKVSLVLVFLIPVILGLIFSITRLWWFIGAPLILMFSLLIYAKLRIISREDVTEIGKSFLPERVLKVGVEKFSWVIKMLYGE